jgi:phage gp29-like protein
MSVLAEFILLGLDKTGSFALADSKTDLFATSLKAILDQIAAVFNNDAIPRLMEMNKLDDPSCWPVMTYGDIESQDLDSLGAYVQRLASAGMITPDPTLEDSLREMASLPIMAQDATPRDIYEEGIMPNVGDSDE